MGNRNIGLPGITYLKIKNNFMKKIILFSVISLTFIMLLNSCSDFNKKGKPLFKDLLELYDLSLTKCKTIQLVWSSAIFEKKYALATTKNFDDYYVPDFNFAMFRMEKDTTISSINTNIDSLTSKVSKNIKTISDKKNPSYDKLLSLYTNVIELSKNARTPNGSLQSFTKDINQKESQINMLITEIKARNPEFEDSKE